MPPQYTPDERAPLMGGGPSPAGLPPAYVDDVGCWAGWVREPHLKCLVLTIGIIVMAVLKSQREMGACEDDACFFSVLGALYLLYIIECSCANTCGFVTNVNADAGIAQHYLLMRQRPPHVAWSISCYHYETRTTTSTDSKGNTTTTTRQERVTTHTARTQYQLEGWQDTSPALKPTSHKYTKVIFGKRYAWRDERARQKHQREYDRWIHHHDRDTHKDVGWTWGIPGWKQNLLCVRDDAELPCWFNPCVYFLASLFLLSWPFRVAASAVTSARKEAIHKVIW